MRKMKAICDSIIIFVIIFSYYLVLGKGTYFDQKVNMFFI